MGGQTVAHLEHLREVEDHCDHFERLLFDHIGQTLVKLIHSVKY